MAPVCWTTAREGDKCCFVIEVEEGGPGCGEIVTVWLILPSEDEVVVILMVTFDERETLYPPPPLTLPPIYCFTFLRPCLVSRIVVNKTLKIRRELHVTVGCSRPVETQVWDCQSTCVCVCSCTRA